MDKLEGAHGGPPRWWGLEHLPCEEMQGQLGWFSLEEGCLQGHLMALPVPMRGHQGDSEAPHSGRTSSNRHKLKQEKLRHPGSATGCPERVCRSVFGGFQDQSRQNLV